MNTDWIRSHLPPCGIIRLLTLLILVLPAIAADQYKFEQLNTKNGLSQDVVLSVMQDSEGFVWVGTQNGLNRYDGFQFTIFKSDPDDSTTLSNNFITSIYEDQDNRLWFGTDGGGVNRYDRDSGAFERISPGASVVENRNRNRIWNMLRDSTGVFWAATSEGPAQIKNDVLESMTDGPLAALANTWIWRFLEDRDGHLWICSFDGLFRLSPDRQTMTTYGKAQGLLNQRVRDIHQNADGTFWIANDGGLNYLDLESGELTEFPSLWLAGIESADTAIRFIHALADDDLLLCTDSGLVRLNPTTRVWTIYRTDPVNPESISSNRSQHLWVDRSGVLWIGTNGGGINKVNPGKARFGHYRNHPGQDKDLNNNHIWTFQEDSDGQVWLGTLEGGLNRWNRQTAQFTHYTHNSKDNSSLSNNNVRSMTLDKNNTLWVGTMTGLNRFNRANNNFTRFEINPGDPNDPRRRANAVTALQAVGDTIWAGTYRGLNRFNPKTGEILRISANVNQPIHLNHEYVTVITPHDEQRLWVGSWAGLNLLTMDPLSIRNIQKDPDDPESLNGFIAIAILKTRGDDLWVGTYGGGISKLVHMQEDGSDARFVHFEEKDGLANNGVYGILEDDQGLLWVSTGAGISRFDPKTEKFTSYDESHGLQGNDFNQGAYLRLSDGTLLFGGPNGFNAFEPQKITENRFIPPVVLTRFSRLNREVKLPKHISQLDQLNLSYRDSVISFQFAALDFTAPEKNRYAYELEGFHPGWIELERSHDITFTNLDPGDYVLRIKGSNSDGVWNEAGRSLAIHIAPPPWRTPLAYFIYVALMAGGLWAAVSLRTWQLQQGRAKLAQLVERRTRELRETQKQLMEAAHRAGKAEIAGSVLHNMGNTLNSIGASNGVISEALERNRLADKIKQMASRLDEKTEAPIAKADIQKLLLTVAKLLEGRNAKLYEETDRIQTELGHLNQVVQAQQEYVMADRLVEDIDLNRLIKRLVNMERAAFAELNIEVVLNLSGTPHIRICQSQLVQILAFLLENARDSLKEDVAKPRVEVRTRTHKDFVRIEVRDNGQGIAEENLVRVFTMGYSSKKDGRGFGLHFCANAVSENGGRIEALSPGLGKGAAIRLEFQVLTPTV